MRKAIILLLATATAAACCAAGTIRTAAELAAINRGEFTDATSFCLTATVTRVNIRPSFPPVFVFDSSGATSLLFDPSLDTQDIRPGDRMDLRGRIRYNPQNGADIVAVSATRIGRETPPRPTEISVADALSGRFDFRIVRLTAIVQDAFADEIDPLYTFLVLLQDGETIYAATTGKIDISELPGATVSLVGACDAYHQPTRRHSGRLISLSGSEDLKILVPGSKDVYSVPDISTIRNASPSHLHAFGRIKARGSVIAAWREGTCLIATDDGEFVQVELANGPLPHIGDIIETVGFPETDLYNISLVRAIWRKVGSSVPDDGAVREIAANDLFSREDGKTIMRPKLHGKAVRLSGLVRSLPNDVNASTLLMECDGHVIPVDLGARPEAARGIDLGCRVSVTGICIMDMDRFRPNMAFPRIRGFMIVLRPKDEIAVLARPTWWTPGRVWAVFGGLVALLLAVFGWNASLRRLAERRSRELAEERISSFASDLKVEERTRIAVELHDTVAQMLTGVSLEIDAARDFAPSDQKEMNRHLDLASRTLSSCRRDLRNCMWDLRNQTLDDIRMDDAIRRTLAPHLSGTELTVRFSVTRVLLSDNTALAILRIIRELTLNAIRHGRATAVRVAGCIEGDRLLFSVTDNGQGFDPSSAPSVDQGHFGLQGITERVELLNGEFTISSTPGNGTRAAVAIKLHRQQTLQS